MQPKHLMRDQHSQQGKNLYNPHSHTYTHARTYIQTCIRKRMGNFKPLEMLYLCDEWVKYKWQFVFQPRRIFSLFNLHVGDGQIFNKKANVWKCSSFFFFYKEWMWFIFNIKSNLHTALMNLCCLSDGFICSPWDEKVEKNSTAKTTTTMELFAVNKETCV